MTSRIKEKKFDAVKMMRKIRDKLSKKYLERPELEDKDLELIRKKYGIKYQEKQNINIPPNNSLKQSCKISE